MYWCRWRAKTGCTFLVSLALPVSPMILLESRQEVLPGQRTFLSWLIKLDVEVSHPAKPAQESTAVVAWSLHQLQVFQVLFIPLLIVSLASKITTETRA